MKLQERSPRFTGLLEAIRNSSNLNTQQLLTTPAQATRLAGSKWSRYRAITTRHDSVM